MTKPIRFSNREGAHPLSVFVPGLGGYYYRVKPGLLTIPVIISPDEGKGIVSAFLDRLPTNERIVFHFVMHPILRKALHRRGFRRVAIHIPEMGDVDDLAYVRNAKKEKAR